jgi:hypothetical protein
VDVVAALACPDNGKKKLSTLAMQAASNKDARILDVPIGAMDRRFVRLVGLETEPLHPFRIMQQALRQLLLPWGPPFNTAAFGGMDCKAAFAMKST